MWASPSGDWRTEPSLDSRDGNAKRPDDSSSDADPEILELAQRFEQAYAGLGPVEPERAAATADLFPEVPDVFEEPAPVRPAAAETARVVKMPRREAEAVAPAPAPSMRAPAPDLADDLGLDEAMAILQASEVRGAGASKVGMDKPRKSRAPAADTPADHDRPRPAVREKEESAVAPTPSPADWSTQSRIGRTVALAVAGVALVVGIGGGYLLAYGTKEKTGLIQASPQGTHLRLDLNLQQR
jgi:hypothetical protein